MNSIEGFFIVLLATLVGQLIGSTIRRYIGRREDLRGSQLDLSRRKFIESLKNSENLDYSQKTALDALFAASEESHTIIDRVKDKYHELTDEPGEFLPDMTEEEFDEYQHRKVSGWDKLYSKLPKIKKDDDAA